MNKSNVLLIGMPATGKSTLGRVLAKKLNKSFIDTDESISELVDMSIQQALDTLGNKGFGEKEHEVLMNIDQQNLVIATGGSAIYQTEAIQFLKQKAITVHLHAEKQSLFERIDNFSTRALVIKGNMTFDDLYQERMPMYETVTDIKVSTDKQVGLEQSLNDVLEKLRQHPDYA